MFILPADDADVTIDKEEGPAVVIVVTDAPATGVGVTDDSADDICGYILEIERVEK